MFAIFKRELRSYFTSLVGYVVIGVMLAFIGLYYSANCLVYGTSDFSTVLYSTTLVMLFLLPALTMRSFADERRNKTDQLLLTSPVGIPSIVMGKYFAQLAVFAVPMAAAAIMPLVLTAFGTISLTSAYATWLAYFLMGAACIAIGTFVSALTENQIIAYLATFGALLICYLMNGIKSLFTSGNTLAFIVFCVVLAVVALLVGLACKNVTVGSAVFCGGAVVLVLLFKLRPAWLLTGFNSVLGALALFQPFTDFVGGMFSVTGIVYYLSVAGLFLFLTGQALERRRSLRSGAYASVLAVVVLVLVILLNLVVGAVPTKFTQFDISTGKMFTLSDTTKTMLQELNTDVTAYYLAETGNEDSNITRILDRYAGESSHFTWQQRDPALYPTFAQQYDAQNASSSSVILVCGDNHTVVDYNDMYTADYSSYYTTGSYTMSFSAENALSSGIAKVTRENSYVLYQLTGHGESSLESDFTETLDNSGVTMQDLNLLTTDTVPEDAAALLINDPQADLSTLDAAAIKTYLENGGHLFVTTDLTVDTPNLDALLAEYGMTRQEGLVIENDSSYYAYRYPQTYLLPSLSSNDITAGITDGMHVFTPVAQGIVKGDSTDDLTLTTLLSTSSTAYAMQDYAEATTAEQGANDPNGPFNIAVAASNSATGAKVVWVNCPNMLNSQMNSAVSGGNAQLLTSAVNWMTGEENGVVIDSKSMSAETLTVPAKATMLLGLLFTIVVPLAFIVVGIAITLVRRRR